MIRLNLKTRNQRFGSIVVHTLPFTILTTVFQVQFLLRGSKSFLSQGFLRLQCISSFFFRNCQILYICSENRAKGISGFSSMPSWKTIIPSKCLPFHNRKLPDSIVFFETRQLFWWNSNFLDKTFEKNIIKTMLESVWDAWIKTQTVPSQLHTQCWQFSAAFTVAKETPCVFAANELLHSHMLPWQDYGTNTASCTVRRVSKNFCYLILETFIKSKISFFHKYLRSQIWFHEVWAPIPWLRCRKHFLHADDIALVNVY